MEKKCSTLFAALLLFVSRCSQANTSVAGNAEIVPEYTSPEDHELMQLLSVPNYETILFSFVAPSDTSDMFITLNKLTDEIQWEEIIVASATFSDEEESSFAAKGTVAILFDFSTNNWVVNHIFENGSSFSLSQTDSTPFLESDLTGFTMLSENEDIELHTPVDLALFIGGGGDHINIPNISEDDLLFITHEDMQSEHAYLWQVVFD